MLLAPNRPPERRTVDFVAGRPAFAANRRHLFRAAGGRIWRDDPLGPEPWGEVLAGQTRLFLGEELGLGLYRAGELSVLFLFHPERRGLLEVPGLPRLAGQLIDVAAVLGEGRAWVRFTLERGGRPRELLVVVDAGGGIVATAEEEVGGWTQGLPGACPSRGFLLVPTDGGIARYEVQGGAIVRGREFPDSEPFVDAASRLLLTRDGLCVVAERSITQLTLNE